MQPVIYSETCFNSLLIIQSPLHLFHHPAALPIVLRITKLHWQNKITCFSDMHIMCCSYIHIYFFYGQSGMRRFKRRSHSEQTFFVLLWTDRQLFPYKIHTFLHRQQNMTNLWISSSISSFFFLFSFIVLDLVSYWGILSSWGSVVRVVEDRAQFCFSALLWDDRVVPLPWICSCQQKHLLRWGGGAHRCLQTYVNTRQGPHTHMRTFTTHKLIDTCLWRQFRKFVLKPTTKCRHDFDTGLLIKLHDSCYYFRCSSEK